MLNFLNLNKLYFVFFSLLHPMPGLKITYKNPLQEKYKNFYSLQWLIKDCKTLKKKIFLNINFRPKYPIMLNQTR